MNVHFCKQKNNNNKKTNTKQTCKVFVFILLISFVLLGSIARPNVTLMFMKSDMCDPFLPSREPSSTAFQIKSDVPCTRSDCMIQRNTLQKIQVILCRSFGKKKKRLQGFLYASLGKYVENIDVLRPANTHILYDYTLYCSCSGATVISHIVIFVVF